MVGHWDFTRKASPILSPEQFVCKTLLTPCIGLVVLYHNVVLGSSPPFGHFAMSFGRA